MKILGLLAAVVVITASPVMVMADDGCVTYEKPVGGNQIPTISYQEYGTVSFYTSRTGEELMIWACGSGWVYIGDGETWTATCTEENVATYVSVWAEDDLIQVTVCPPVVTSGTEVEHEWYDYGCSVASIDTCTAAGSDDVRLYANGLNVGTCVSVPATFSARPLYTNTITLLASDVFTLYQIDVSCSEYLTVEALGPITPTLPVPVVITVPQGSQAVLDGGGFLGIKFGGSLSDPGSPINTWLGHATSFLAIINRGNLLYIVGAVGTAGMILAWAIHTVRHPETF